MRAAVMSNTPCGKSTLIFLLAGVFSRSHRRHVSILSTSKMDETTLKYVEIKDTAGIESSPGVLKALLDTGSIELSDIYNYGLRVGFEEVYCFDIFNSDMEVSTTNEFFQSMLDKIGKGFEIVEVKSNIYNKHTQDLLRKLETKLYCFDLSPAGIKSVNDYRSRMPEDIVRKTGYVCCQYHPQVISENKLAKLLSIPLHDLMTVPYSPAVQKHIMEGTLNRLAEKIIVGQHEVVPLRMKLYDVMTYCFDTTSVKTVKRVNLWSK